MRVKLGRNMSDTVTEISRFRFNSLRKYMAPVYAQMNFHLHDSKEQKTDLISRLIREFFSRMREHRGISLAELAERSKIEMSDLEAFERGDKKASRWIEAAYLSVCCAHHEMEFFCQQAHEFQNPSVKDSKIDVAKAALKQFGVMIPGVDYKRLHSEGGAVLSFPQGGQ